MIAGAPELTLAISTGRAGEGASFVMNSLHEKSCIETLPGSGSSGLQLLLRPAGGVLEKICMGISWDHCEERQARPLQEGKIFSDNGKNISQISAGLRCANSRRQAPVSNPCMLGRCTEVQQRRIMPASLKDYANEGMDIAFIQLKSILIK